MLSRLLRYIFAVFLILSILFVIIFAAIGPEFIPDDFKAQIISYFKGSNAGIIIIALVVICTVVAFFVSPMQFRKLLSSNQDRPASFSIPPTYTNRQLLKDARNATSNASPESALRALSEIGNTQLDNELAVLSANWVNYSKLHPQIDPKDKAFRSINKGVLDLITSIEKELSKVVDFDVQIRKHLKERYQKRLSQKMAGRQPVNIRRLTTTVGTSKETAATFVSNIDQEVQDEMSKLFQLAKGRLLIVGAPGSGKTTLLLRWIIDLLDREQDYLPVIVNLATWRSGFVDFKAWLLEILPAELSVNKNLAQEILAQDRLLLLCDGFDEVKEEDRESLLAAIGKYGSAPQREFVISSRIEEYKKVAKDAPVKLEIEVCPLTLEQLEVELKKPDYEPEGARLLVAMQKDKHLRKAIQAPFYFNALQLLFANGIRLQDLQFKTRSNKGREEELKRQFVDFALEGKKEEIKHYHRWLSFLASRMNQPDKNLVSFELTDFQYDWWWWSKIEIRTSNFLEGLILGLVFGLVAGPILGLILGLVAGLVVGLVFGLVFGLVVGLVVGLGGGLGGGLVAGLSSNDLYKNPYINTRDNFYFSWRKYFYSLKKNLVAGLVVGLVAGLFEGLFTGMVGGLIAGLGTGLGVWLLDMLKNRYSYFIQINQPYQRFYGSMKIFYFSILQHWHLFHLFHKYNLLPKNIVPFLNEMTRRHILESDGASWRFRHRILQDYFAEQWVEITEESEIKEP